MKRRNLLLAAASAGILSLAAIAPAGALDIGLGNKGGSKSGVSVNVRVGNTSVKAKALSNKGVANVKVKSGSLHTKAKVGVLNKRGVANAKVSTGLLKTKAKVGVLNKRGVANVKVSTGLLGTKAKLDVLSGGKLLGLRVGIGGTGKGGHGGGGGGGGGGGDVPGPIAGMSDGQVQAMQVRCYDILNGPRRYEASLVALCQLLQKL